MSVRSAPGAENVLSMTRSTSSCDWGMATPVCEGNASRTAGGIVNRPCARGTLQKNSAPIGPFGTKEYPEIWTYSWGSVFPGSFQVTVNPCERTTLPELPGVEELKPLPPPGQLTSA